MNNEADIKFCKRCIFNTQVDPDLYLDEEGICNHCRLYDAKAEALRNDSTNSFENIIEKIRLSGNNKKYDCIVAISGGVDSCYSAYLIKSKGLRPLAVHLDNGWNSELAVSNINKIVTLLGLDLYTHVINWEEFKDIQLAYLKASVVDIEAPTDHAIFATLYKAAAKFDVKYIISGENLATEGFLPESWTFLKNDVLNIKSIHKRFSNKPLKTFPTLGYFKQWYYERVMRIEKINLLDHYNYVRKDAKQLLQNDFGWRDYGGKHYESIITRFYQSYILPQKFGIDKRYSHCSTLICSGQMSRENALVEVSHPAYDQQRISEDKQYVIKKLGLTSDEFDALMSLPIHEHSDYNSIINIVERFRPFAEIAKFLLGQKLTYDVSRKHGIAVLLDNPFERDNRVLLEASELAKHYDVTLYVMKAAHLPTFEVKNGIKVKRIFDEDIHRLPKRKKLKRYARVIARKGYAVVHANDYLMLDLGSKVKQLIPNSKLIYDSHELFHSWPLNLVNPTLSVRIKANVTRWLQVYYEKKHSKYIDRLITVNDSLATILKKYFNHPYQVVVLRNLPMFQEVEKQNDLLRKYFNIPSHQKILVYIGMHVYLKSRNVTSVMDQVGNRPDVAFVLICKDDVNRQAVADYVKHTGYTNIYFHNLLLPNEMSGYLGECDAGLVPTWNKKDLSYWYALDTKMFNYIMAEIPVLATMQPEYISIVNKYRVGVCVNPDEPNAYINGLVEILKRKDFFVENSIKAKQELNWEKESEKLIDLYKELIPEIVIVNIPESA